MAKPKLTLRFRRSYRRSLEQVGDIGTQAEEQVERHVIERLGRLLNVKRFVAVWLALLIFLTGGVIAQMRALANYYQTFKPIAGGTFTEGILGDFTNASPLYATGSVDSAVSRLIFAGLLTYNDQNQLVGDLAKSWDADATGKIYTVHLLPNLTWQDGQPLTADDVVFTYQAIQNPDAQSPLNDSWQGVTVAKVNDTTVTFTLPDPLTAFPYSLTNGIVPKHLLGALSMDQMRSASFNTSDPVGAGPFAWQTIQVLGSSPPTRQEEIALTPFAHYHAGAPKLDSFNVHSFHDQQQLITSFQHDEVDSVAGLNTVPDSLRKLKDLQVYHLPLTEASMVFFNNTVGVLSDPKVRQALVQAVDTDRIIADLGYPVIPVREPLLMNQLGFNPAYEQASFDPNASAQALQANGWLPAKGGIRYKSGQPLSFTLFLSDNAESYKVAQTMRQEWRVVGADVQLFPEQDTDLESTIAPIPRNYDALLYNISIGSDPDVFAYWDSSQADVHSPTHLNFSEYKSSVADAALEGGRTRSDPGLRVLKYKPFLQAWQQDAPALGLYQPAFLYLTRESVAGLNEHMINEDTDRFNNVQNWEIRQAKVTDQVVN